MAENDYKVNEIFDPTFENLTKAIERAAKKQAVISQNIANINTPGYEPLEFDEALNTAVKRSNKNMVVEEEMAALSKNSMEHSAYVKFLVTKISILKTLATQGRK
jgi:flagellar basal body rod protein FlgB